MLLDIVTHGHKLSKRERDLRLVGFEVPSL
jgi:hypothetical protein